MLSHYAMWACSVMCIANYSHSFTGIVQWDVWMRGQQIVVGCQYVPFTVVCVAGFHIPLCVLVALCNLHYGFRCFMFLILMSFLIDCLLKYRSESWLNIILLLIRTHLIFLTFRLWCVIVTEVLFLTSWQIFMKAWTT